MSIMLQWFLAILFDPDVNLLALGRSSAAARRFRSARAKDLVPGYCASFGCAPPLDTVYIGLRCN